MDFGRAIKETSRHRRTPREAEGIVFPCARLVPPPARQRGEKIALQACGRHLSKSGMGESDEPEKIWDEYDWERFLQEQDRKTEKYMELLERYIDDPNRDQIIACEMGWFHLLDKDGERWADDMDSLFEEENGLLNMEEGEGCETGDDGAELEESFAVHPLYKASFALTIWIDQLFEDMQGIQSQPAAARLSTNAAIASAKLAAALSDDDVDELGMTIAYLKRALKAITTAMEAAGQLRKDAALDSERFGMLNLRLFQIRDGIIELMGQCRTEWRRRYDGE